MVVYQCDRCKRYYNEKGALHKIELSSKWYDDNPNFNCWFSDSTKEIKAEVCESCLDEMYNIFIKGFGEDNLREAGNDV